MSRHIRNETCPACRKRGQDKSGDNLGIYDDGHVYCWRCGYYKPPTNIAKVQKYVKQEIVETSAITLPYDCDSYIPSVAREWIGKYSLTEIDLIQNKLMWSEYFQMLIFPYFDVYSNLLGWQGRCFGPTKEGKKPRKWFSKGDLDNIFHILPIQKKYENLILVEDIVSAIKVGHVCPSMPLFTSTARNRLGRLSKVTPKVTYWLDPDMRTKTLIEADRARSLGLEVEVVFTEKDPKEHSLTEIKSILQEDGSIYRIS